MGAVGLLAETLQQTVENPALCQAGVEFPRLYVKVQEIEVPGEGFRLELRRPLTLRILHELDYWLVNDNKTLVWGTAETPGAALLDYMREWRDRFQWLRENQNELGSVLLAELKHLKRLAA